MGSIATVIFILVGIFLAGVYLWAGNEFCKIEESMNRMQAGTRRAGEKADHRL